LATLGIDVGSLYAGLVLVDGDGNILQKAYLRHHGEPVRTVREALADFPLEEVGAVTRTGSGGRDLPFGGGCIDAVVAQVEGVRALAPEVRNILYIGGGSFSLTRLDEEGHYQRSVANSACASGTGAFLDQQALRLQVPPMELADKAMRYEETPPGVATRCAVFAKSDMIHLQQEGYSTDAIAAGLCRGLGHSTVDGLLSGHEIEGKTAVIGGVARNHVVIDAVRENLGVETVVPDEPELVSAYGAALYARQHPAEAPFAPGALEEGGPAGDEAGSGAAQPAHLRPPLKLELSDYPDVTYHDYHVDDNKTEVALITPRDGAVPVTLGIDIGSTSTKAALLDLDKQVVAWVYRKTAGDPIGAVQKVFSALRDLQARGGFALDIRAVGTTGSGRKMIQAVIGADMAVNEISAHARAAVFLDPEVDTILELGGQDAKFTQLQDGVVYNAVMNYVCAAGTGSFIEEQALKLGVPVQDYADFAMGVPCPQTSDRCTVYMERDLDVLQARGWSKPAIAAAVLHSVRDNYLNKVVSGLYIGNHVCFQGATARNRALVAAFESELGVPIKVSPYCHVTGSLGMCLLCQERFEGRSAFRGLEFADEEVSVTYEVCELCHNRCNLSIIHTGEATVAWGLKCGRDYESAKPVVKKAEGYEFLRKREAAWRKDLNAVAEGPMVGLPRSLGVYGAVPMWRAFFQALGCRTKLSPRSSEELLKLGTATSTAEYCAPVLMSHGHVRALAEDGEVDHIFVPHLIRAENPHGFTDAHYCAYLQAHPGVLAANDHLDLEGRMLSPIVQMQLGTTYMVDRLHEAIGPALGRDRAAVANAWAAARAAQQEFDRTALSLGEAGLRKIASDGGIGIVLVGRPYNTLDPGMALDLPRKIAEMGYTVLYLDMLPLPYEAILEDQHNMYWHYGQKILAAAEYILRQDNLFGVYFTNFMCGPDSYITTYFKDMMARKHKPYIMLQFDGHGADAGYLTRIEAALESFHAWKGAPRPQESSAASPVPSPAAAG
jgi:predicted CoA-substrate-specific enzyme activase